MVTCQYDQDHFLTFDLQRLLHQSDVMNLVKKYDIPAPRYTSYPTVPFWEAETFSSGGWNQSLIKSYDEYQEQGVSLYIHLPFCEQLCLFCGCHKRITKNHSVELPYVEAIISEFQRYVEVLGEKPRIKEIHLGGGSPTFFNDGNLGFMIESILERARLDSDFSFSFEANPVTTTKDHLVTLYNLGFRRISLGIQDFDKRVQEEIRRIQPYELVEKITESARKLGYDSINYDLIYGLPMQTRQTVFETCNQVLNLKPDRIAFYSYAHVPWVKGTGQKKFRDDDIPRGEIKRGLYQTGKELLEAGGYKEIGMDHFALEDDSLYQSQVNNTLHRNFMGYTTSETKMLIGLGASSISDSWYAYAQNEKNIETYLQKVQDGEIPIVKGHILSNEDLEIRKTILNLTTSFRSDWPRLELGHMHIIRKLIEPYQDGLIEIHPDGLEITPKGRPFLRNICMGFDERLAKNQPTNKIFSQAV